MTKRPQPSLYMDIPALVAEKPYHFGHTQEELEALNERLAEHKGMPKRSLAEKIEAKQAFMSILLDFDRVTPKALRTMELIGRVPNHEAGRSELEEMIALNSRTQRVAREGIAAPTPQEALGLEDVGGIAATDRHKTLRERSEKQLNTIHEEIHMRREAVQPMRPRVMHDAQVLRGLDADLYVPYARAFAASVAADRAHPDGKHAMARLPNINALGSDVQAFIVMYDYAESIDKFRRKVVAKAEEAGQDVGMFWKEHREELWPHLQKITDKYNAAMKQNSAQLEAQEKAKGTANQEGFSTLPSYQAWLAAEKALSKPDLFIGLQRPRDVMRHLAMEYFVGGEERDTGERRHKLLTRVEAAYQDDLFSVKEQKKASNNGHSEAVDDARRTPTVFYADPFESNLHTLNRVYEGRWAALADEVMAQFRPKLLSNPDIHTDAITAAERQRAGGAERKVAREAAKQAAKEAAEAEQALNNPHVGEVMSKRHLSTLKRRAEEAKPDRRPDRRAVYYIDGDSSHVDRLVEQARQEKGKGGKAR